MSIAGRTLSFPLLARSSRSGAGGAQKVRGSAPELVEFPTHKASTRRSRIHIFVLIDALGWECRPAQLLLADLLPYRRGLQTVLGFSSGAVPTILTGQPPAATGHWNLFYCDPKESPFRWLRYFEFLPNRLIDNRVGRKLLKEMGRRWLGLGPGFECCVAPSQMRWFNFVEKRNIYAPGGIAGAPSIFDRLQASGIPYCSYTYHDYSDREVLARAREDLTADKANFFFLYLSEMDSFLHFNVADEAAVAKKLAWYESELRSLYKLALEHDSEMTFSIFSDHGMTPVRNRVDLVGEVEKLRLTPQKDYLAVYDSTMARYWFFNPAARAAVEELLRRQACGRIVPESELRRLGIYFPDQRFGELIYLLDPGWLIAKSDFNGSGWNPNGMHGYHPDDAHSSAIFLSNRPRSEEMRTIADVYRCLEEGAGRQERRNR